MSSFCWRPSTCSRHGCRFTHQVRRFPSGHPFWTDFWLPLSGLSCSASFHQLGCCARKSPHFTISWQSPLASSSPGAHVPQTPCGVFIFHQHLQSQLPAQRHTSLNFAQQPFIAFFIQQLLVQRCYPNHQTQGASAVKRGYAGVGRYCYP